jgi:Flp pilus assembly protein TadD
MGLAVAACSTTETGTAAPDVEAVDQKTAAPAIDTQPQSPEFVKQIGTSRALLDNGKATEALVVLEQAREASPNAFAVHNNLCVAYGELGLKDAAVNACRVAVELDPNSQLAKNNLGWVSSLPSDVAK